MLKSFEIDGLRYRPVQKLNGGTQWRCDYLDHTWAAAMVYKKNPTQADIIDAVVLVNENREND